MGSEGIRLKKENYDLTSLNYKYSQINPMKEPEEQKKRNMVV